jgi:translation elongation factor P/translation initiation factor 5A
MEKYIFLLKQGDLIDINNDVYKIKNIQGVHKTKRRYESSLFYPKGASYDKYMLKAINILTGEELIPLDNIYYASKLFKCVSLTKTKYYVVDINDDIITLLTEDNDEKKININEYTKLKNYIHDEITLLTYKSKIIDIL